MLRVTGAIAAVATAFLAVLLFGRIHSFTLSGRAEIAENGVLCLFTRSQPPLMNFLVGAESQRGFNAIVDFYPDGGVGLFFEPTAGVEEIPKDAIVDVTHRWVGFRRPGWVFQCTEIRSGGRTYPQRRSPAAFFWTLGAVTAAPLLCWSAFALAAAVLRTSRPRD